MAMPCPAHRPAANHGGTRQPWKARLDQLLQAEGERRVPHEDLVLGHLAEVLHEADHRVRRQRPALGEDPAGVDLGGQ